MSVRFNKFSNGSELKVNMCVCFNDLLTIPSPQRNNTLPLQYTPDICVAGHHQP